MKDPEHWELRKTPNRPRQLTKIKLLFMPNAAEGGINQFFTAPMSTSCLHVSGTHKERADPTVLKLDGWKGAKIFEGKKEESVTRPKAQRLPGVGLPVKLQYIKGSRV